MRHSPSQVGSLLPTRLCCLAQQVLGVNQYGVDVGHQALLRDLFHRFSFE
jgi:hypothetical protein